MTKIRPALSFEQALDRVCSALGWPEAAALVGKRERTLRDYGDPDLPQRISLEDGYTLDKAYHDAGGDGWPILQCYIFRLKAEAAVFMPDVDAHARVLGTAAIETGQALAAQIALTRSGATPADRALAKRETEQALTALTHTLPWLDGDVPSAAVVTAPGGASAA